MKRFLSFLLLAVPSVSFAQKPPPLYAGLSCVEKGKFGAMCTIKYRADRAKKPFDCLVMGLPGSGGGLMGHDDYTTDFSDTMNCATASIASGSALSGFTEKILESTLTSMLRFDAIEHPELKKAPIFTLGWSLGSINGVMGASNYNDRLLGASGGSGNFYWQYRMIDEPVGCCRGRCAPEKIKCPNVPDIYDVDAVFVNGEKDNNTATSLKAAQDNLKLARQKGYERGTLAIAWGEGHLNPTWNPKNSHVASDFIYLYLYDLYQGRKAMGPTTDLNGYVKYPKMPVAKGWFGEGQDYDGQHGKPVKAIKTEIEIAPYSDFKGDKLIASWMPSERSARAYRAMVRKQATPIVIEGLKIRSSYLPDELVTFNVVGTFKNVEIIVSNNKEICKQLPCSFKPNQIGGGVIPVFVKADGAEAFRSIVVRNNGEELPIKSEEIEFIVEAPYSVVRRVTLKNLELVKATLKAFGQPVTKIEIVVNGTVAKTVERTKWGWQRWQLTSDVRASDVKAKTFTSVGVRVHTEGKVYEKIETVN